MKFNTLAVSMLFYSVRSSASRIFCPRVESVDRTVTMDTSNNGRDFSEISGIAFSSQYNAPSGQPILYAINDGSDKEGKLGVWDSGTGKRLLTLALPNIKNQDWEAMEMGPCRVDSSEGKMSYCIFIAETGDNEARYSRGAQTQRNSYKIIRIHEPDYRDYDDNDDLPVDSMSVLTFDYKDPSSPTQFSDCEAIFIDPVGWSSDGDGNIGDIYLVTKWDDWDTRRNNRLFKIPASAWSNLNIVHSPKAIGSFSGMNPFLFSQWTRASMTQDGTLLALGSYDKTQIFLRCPGSSVADAIRAGTPCLTHTNIVSGQMETTAWTPDGLRSLEIPEKDYGSMGWVNMVYGQSQNSAKCPLVRYADETCIDVETGQYYPDSWCEETASMYSDADFERATQQLHSQTLSASSNSALGVFFSLACTLILGITT
jgi:hypothetical protein